MTDSLFVQKEKASVNQGHADSPHILLMGGKPTGSCELARAAKDAGAYLIVTDYLPRNQSPAKEIADDCWDCSTADVNTLLSLCNKAGVTGLIAGVHEFNIERMAELAQLLLC